MDAETRMIKEEASNEDGRPDAVGCRDDGDGDGDGGEVGTGNDNDNEIIMHQKASPTVHMKTIYSLNMNVCRLCLSEGHGQLQPVFYAQDTVDEILQQKILELTTVEITYANDFPTGVCIDCLAKLDEYSLFRRQCIESNEILKLKYLELKAVAESYCKQEENDHHQLELLREQQCVSSSTSTKLSGRVKKEEEGFTEIESTGAEETADGVVIVARRSEEGDVLMEASECAVEQQAEAASPYVPFADDGGAGGAGEEIIIGDGNEEDDDDTGRHRRHRVVAAGTKVQYVCEDGTMTEYVTSGAIVRREGEVGEIIEEHGEGQDMYYTVGADTYTIQTANVEEGYPNAASGYVPPEFENQTEIECTTIEEHLPEEYVELEQQQQGAAGGPLAGGVSAASATVVTSRGLHDRPFVCKHCKTSFKYEHNYDRHMKNHAKVLYRCSKCSKTFVKQRKCQQHFLKAHSSQRYECDICFRTYSLPTRLENHVIEMHSVNGVYSCDRCQGEMFSSYLDFKAHRMRFHPRTNDSGGSGGADTTMPTIIKQTAYGDVVHMQQVLTLNPQALASSDSPTPSSDGCEMEDVQTVNPPPSTTKPPATARGSTTTTTTQQRARRTNGRRATVGNRSGKAAQRAGVVQQRRSLAVPLVSAQQEVILIDDDEQQLSGSLMESSSSSGGATGGSVVMLHTNGGGGGGTHSSSGESNCANNAAVHRELLQQIEESEAKASGPKVYPCKSCDKTFVHLNNLKAHIYAEHDNDKPFKCKQCPISFKTKEILVMHMLLHAQNNSAT